MARPSVSPEKLFVLSRKNFPQLFESLDKRGYQILGPTPRDGAVVYDGLQSVEDLPIGLTDEHEGGTYRLKARRDKALFGYVVGPQSWKKFLHPPKLRLWQAKKNGPGFQITPESEEIKPLAFVGVRPCELSAIFIQDRILTKGEFVDAHYRKQRQDTLVVAVNCTEPGGTCFCDSMNTGPRAEFGFDLALTEVLDKKDHYFVIEVGTKKGEEVLKELPHEVATEAQVTLAEQLLAKAADKMGRSMDTTDIKNLLYRNYEHPQWQQVAERCLACTNCTMVCPTCFCTTVEDVTDLAGTQAERWRRWDSCYTKDFSYVHGGSVRTSGSARYRHWITHKLATWIDQFGASGCVGCGRCITWCPVGIDITEEVHNLRASEANQQPQTSSKE